jgi:hypothetical protein
MKHELNLESVSPVAELDRLINEAFESEHSPARKELQRIIAASGGSLAKLTNLVIKAYLAGRCSTRRPS